MANPDLTARMWKSPRVWRGSGLGANTFCIILLVSLIFLLCIIKILKSLAQSLQLLALISKKRTRWQVPFAPKQTFPGSCWRRPGIVLSLGGARAPAVSRFC